MAEARRARARAVRRRARARGRGSSARSSCRRCRGSGAPRRSQAPWPPERGRPPAPRRCPARARRAGPRTLAPSRPLARSSGSRSSRSRSARYVGARETSVFAVQHARGRAAARRRSRAQVRDALAAERRDEPARGRAATTLDRRARRVPGVRDVHLRPRVPAHARVIVSPERPVLVAAPGGTTRGSSRRAARAPRGCAHPRLLDCRGSGSPKRRRRAVGDALPPSAAARGARARAARAARALPGGVALVRAGEGELTLVLAAGSRSGSATPATCG